MPRVSLTYHLAGSITYATTNTNGTVALRVPSKALNELKMKPGDAVNWRVIDGHLEGHLTTVSIQETKSKDTCRRPTVPFLPPLPGKDP
jgi:hypothetical protein